MPDGHIVLQYIAGRLTVPSAAAGEMPATAEEAQAIRARGDRRAELCGKEGGFVVAEVSVLPPLPRAAQVRAWLSAHGWTAGGPGPAGAIWRRPQRGVCIAVVHEDGDSHAIEGALRRIAAAEERPAWQIALEMTAMEDGDG
jgi:hypothetical protein